MPRGASIFASCFFVWTGIWTGLGGNAFAQSGQTKSLEFSGSPLTLPYVCTEEDLDWAGLACGDAPCPVYLELSHASGAGNVILIVGDFHATAATLYSVLLRSDDAGRTWSEPFGRVRGAALDQVQMYDAQTAWVSGGVTQPIGLDPFMLVTQDGGKTWDRVALFEEGTPGSIVKFAFESREHGRALVDRGGGERRYEVYETSNGGRDWSLQQTAEEAPALKAAPEASWRVHPESKLFRLQHLEDGHWLPFAAFALNAANCHETAPEAPAKPEFDEPKPPDHASH